MDQGLLPIWRINSGDELGAAIRQARRDKGWTQDELAKRSNVGRMTISRLERGGDVSAATTARCVSELGCVLVMVPKAARVTARGV